MLKQKDLMQVQGELQSYEVSLIPFGFRGQQAKKPRHCEGYTW